MAVSLRALFLAPLLALCSCAGGPERAPAPFVGTLVLIKSGPRQPSKPEAERVFGDHMNNMVKLARAGRLVLAGPYGRQKSDRDLRGIFVLDTVDPGMAKLIAQTDPGYEYGAFVFEYHDFATNAPLRRILAEELAEMDARGPQAPGTGMRGYVLVTSDNGPVARAALENRPGTLLVARLDGERVMALLDASDTGVALRMLKPIEAVLGKYTLDEWYATKRLAQLGGGKAGA